MWVDIFSVILVEILSFAKRGPYGIVELIIFQWYNLNKKKDDNLPHLCVLSTCFNFATVFSI